MRWLGTAWFTSDKVCHTFRVGCPWSFFSISFSFALFSILLLSFSRENVNNNCTAFFAFCISASWEVSCCVQTCSGIRCLGWSGFTWSQLFSARHHYSWQGLRQSPYGELSQAPVQGIRQWYDMLALLSVSFLSSYLVYFVGNCLSRSCCVFLTSFSLRLCFFFGVLFFPIKLFSLFQTRIKCYQVFQNRQKSSNNVGWSL